MKLLLIVSLIISTIGILILLILSNNLQPEKIKIKEINSEDLNKKIQTQGIITSIKTFQEFQIINIKQNNSSLAVLINKKIKLNKNQTIEVIGRITEYHNNLEIQAEKIKIIKK